jgi:serine/threonine protein kinase
MSTPAEVLGPAERLLNVELVDGWVVTNRITRDPGCTGQSRSACYCAKKGDETAFVKAFDFRGEEKTRTVDQLNDMTAEFINERRVHEICRDNNLTRVTTIIGSGGVEVSGEVVHYIICEFAERSLRELHPPGEEVIAPAERLLALRQVTSALEQLHGASIAHQDVKPSNAVRHDGVFKLTDLGSSSCKHLPPAPHDLEWFAGQPAYAPYELLYAERGSWEQRRLGCDIFLLGNMAFTSFVGHSITYFVVGTLPEAMKPFGDHAVRFTEVLPDLVENHRQMIPEVVNVCVPAVIAKEFLELIDTMCHPDPQRRGHPKNILGSGSRYGLERYRSKFDQLAAIARKLSVAA